MEQAKPLALCGVHLFLRCQSVLWLCAIKGLWLLHISACKQIVVHYFLLFLCSARTTLHEHCMNYFAYFVDKAKGGKSRFWIEWRFFAINDKFFKMSINSLDIFTKFPTIEKRFQLTWNIKHQQVTELCCVPMNLFLVWKAIKATERKKWAN